MQYIGEEIAHKFRSLLFLLNDSKSVRDSIKIEARVKVWWGKGVTTNPQLRVFDQPPHLDTYNKGTFRANIYNVLIVLKWINKFYLWSVNYFLHKHSSFKAFIDDGFWKFFSANNEDDYPESFSILNKKVNNRQTSGKLLPKDWQVVSFASS